VDDVALFGSGRRKCVEGCLPGLICCVGFLEDNGYVGEGGDEARVGDRSWIVDNLDSAVSRSFHASPHLNFIE
jgi:hypothetical protein